MVGPNGEAVLSAPPLGRFWNNAGALRRTLSTRAHIQSSQKGRSRDEQGYRVGSAFGCASSLCAWAKHANSNRPESACQQEVRRLNAEETQAFLHRDAKALATLWSDDLAVTNPLNKFVTKQQVLGMIDSGLLVITSYARSIEYIRVYGDTAIVAGSETVV
ncbi:MAG: hypothetical protein DMG93_22565 [Acidobacteria bacterium]|nr:MAG: hypothetical protein DMG93_22565 [Acidobacteriota bacterium]